MHTFGKRCAHDDPTHTGGSGEVSLAALSPAGGQVGVDLGHCGVDGEQWMVVVGD